MAVSKVADRASVASNSAVTTVDLVMTGLTVGNILIIRTAADNSGGGGAARTISVSDQSGSILNGAGWTAEQRNQDPGAASAGVTANLLIVLIQATSGTLRLTYSGSVVQAAVAEEWTGLAGISAVGTTGNNVGTASTNLASVTKSATSGNLVYAIEAVEGPNGDTYTNDADTTNGSWTPLTKLGTTNATATDNVTVYGGYKVVTGTGSQTYNPTINNARDSAGIIVELLAVATISGTITTAFSGWTATAGGQTMRTGTIDTAWGGWTATAAGTVPNVRMDIVNLRNRDWGYAEHVGIIGGYGQGIVEVTNLHDSGAGSLREALENEEGLRHIVLTTDVSVMLNTPIVCTGSLITLDATGHSLIIQSGFEDENTITFTGTHVIVAGVQFRTSSGVGFDSLRFRGAGPYMVSGCKFFSTFDPDDAGDALSFTHRGSNDVYATVVGCEFHNLKRAVVIHSGNNDSTEDEGAYFVTMAWNHIHHVREAFPLAREAHVHLYNNLIERWGEFDGTSTPGARMSNDGVTLQTGFTNWMLAENNVVLPLTTGEADYAGDTTTTPLTEWFGPGTNDGSPNMRADGTYLKVNGSTTPTETEVNPGDVGTPPYAYRLMTADDTLQTFIAAHTGDSLNGGVVPPDYDPAVSVALGSAEANSGQTIGFVRNGEVVTVLTEGSGTVDTMTLWVGGDSFAMTESPTGTWTATLSGLTDGVEDMWAVGTGSGFVGETRTPIWPVIVYTPTISGAIASNWGGWTATAVGSVTGAAPTHDGTISTAFEGWTATASATVEHPATVTTAWAGWSATADGVITHPATVATAWSGWTATAQGHRVWDATIATAFSGWTATATATVVHPATITTALDGWTATATATRETAATATTAWSGWTATATGEPTHHATITTAWAGWSATADGVVTIHARIHTVWAEWVVAADDFNRADTTSPTGGGGAGLGAGWDAPGWKIVSNRAQKDGGNDVGLLLADLGTTDHWVEFEVVGTPGTPNPFYTVIHAASENPKEQNAVVGFVEPGGSKQGTIAQYQGGSFTIVSAGTTGLDITGTYTLRLWVSDGEARLYHNGVLVDTHDVSALTLGEFAGVAAQNASPPIDNFRAGTLGWRATAVGHRVWAGTVATAWDGWTATATGTVTTSVNGTIDTAWAGWSATATATRETFGTITTAWSGWTATADGLRTTAGAITTIWSGWTATADGTVTRHATIATAFEGWTATAAGHRVFDAAITTAWAGWTATAVGEVSTPGGTVDGTITTAWSGWTATAAGVVTHLATIDTAWAGWTATALGHRVWDATIATAWGGWTATAAATRTVNATITTALGGWTATAAATRTTSGVILTAWGGWTATATGLRTTAGAITTVWAGWTATAIAETAGQVNASIATEWAGWTATATATVTVVATIDTTWGAWSGIAVATRQVNGTVETLWGGWDAQGTAILTRLGTISTGWAGWTATAIGTRTINALGTGVWGGWTATAVASVFGTIVIIGILTAVRVDPIRTATSVAPGRSAVRVNPVLTAESATPQRIATRHDPNRVASRP